MTRILLDANVNVDMGGFVALHPEGNDPSDEGLAIGSESVLLWSEETKTFAFSTMSKAGAVRLIVEEFDDRPAAALQSLWHEHEEVSALLTNMEYVIADWEGFGPGTPLVVFTRMGQMRLRLSSRGRDTPVEMQSTDEANINEQYYLQVWPE